MTKWHPNPEFDVEAEQRDMRARATRTENLRNLYRLVAPKFAPEGTNLVYVLPLSSRIGHLAPEPQILRTLYGEKYSRIVVVTAPMSVPGTNPWVRECFDDKIAFVETNDDVILAMGHMQGGMADLERFHLLLQWSRGLFVSGWRHVVSGKPLVPMVLPDRIAAPAAERLAAAGLDVDRPFVVLHARTMQFLAKLKHHEYRTVSLENYALSVRAVLDAGYQVVRIGEPGLSLGPGNWDGYISLPDTIPDDRSVDLYVMAKARFAIIQNSGPMTVLAGFGRRTLRTNLPLEHLTLAYNDDLMMFKSYRETATNRILNYGEILDRRLPSILHSEKLLEQGLELVENDPDILRAATMEMLGATSGDWKPDEARNARFFAAGAKYEAEVAQDQWFQKQNLDFYAYAHPLGNVTNAFFEANPVFLD